MRRKLKSALSGGVTLLVAAAVLLTGAAPAFAAAPAWEPDPNALGAVVFYDAAGNVLTGGSDLNHLADYAAATTAGSPGATRANLIFAAPDHTKVTGLWATGSGSANTTYPNNAAPAPITGPGFANPLVTLGATDANLNAFLGSIVKDTTPGYANVYQVRVKDTGSGGAGSGTKYWETNIAVDEAAGTWSVLWPEVTTTTTSITTTPPNGGSTETGNDVTLSATVTPASNGSIQFFDGGTAVGSPHPVTTGSPTANQTDTAPAIGTHQYTAEFTPSGGTPVQGSTSPASTVEVTPPQTPTSTALSANPSTAQQYSPVTLTANVTPLEAVPGTMEFFDGASSLGTDTTDGPPGEYQLTTSTLTLGTHSITATFTPGDNSYARSTSQPVTVEITPSDCPGEPDPEGRRCTDEQTIEVTVNPGSLTITTPYTPQNPFVLPDMVLNPAGTLLSTSARFPHESDDQIVVTSSLAGNPNWTASVSGTDLTSGSKTIDGQGLGLTGGTLLPSPVFPGTVAFTDNPARNPNAPGADHGIKGGPWTFAQSSGGGNGSAAMYGTLTLLAPTSTQAGTYTGTITFSVA